MRSYAREVAFCKIYGSLMGGDVDGFEQFESDLTEEDKQFASSLAQGAIANREKADSIIGEFAQGYKLDRIYRVDLAAMEMAIYEIESIGTPAPIAVDEAVSIVKKYSTKSSVSFVNGILAAWLRSAR